MAQEYTIGGKGTSVKISITGLPETDAKFNKLDAKVRKSIGKKALRQATNVALRYARQFVLKDTKKLMKGLRTQSLDVGKKSRLAGNFGMKVAVARSKREELHYVRYVQYDPRLAGGGNEGTRFMKRAFIAAKPEAKRIFKSKLQELIRSETEKAVPNG